MRDDGDADDMSWMQILFASMAAIRMKRMLPEIGTEVLSMATSDDSSDV